VLAADAVTYFSEATSDNVSERRVIGVTVSDSVVGLVKSVKSGGDGCRNLFRSMR
jgi:hypothetical protein